MAVSISLPVNVLSRNTLEEAVQYPQLTIGVSGYTLPFNALTPEQRPDAIAGNFTARR